jgi:glycosyltransferase involved in cell wall biosynthesis
MKVLYVATSYPEDEDDWRGVFIRHQAYALSRVENLSLTVWAPPGPLPANARYLAIEEERNWLSQLMSEGGIAHAVRSSGPMAIPKIAKLLNQLRLLYKREGDPDIYHLNWLQTALPLPANGKPALMTVLGTDLKLLGLPLVKPLLRRVMRKRKVAICPNAEWMREPLESAFGDLAQICPVPFGIDPVWYAIKRKPDAQAPCWLAVTRLTRDKLGTLFEWSAPLFDGQHRELHLIGPMQEQMDLPDWVHYHGPGTPAQLAREWFGRAHGLITLSQHAEGRPQVMLEAMAAGLPIIASDMPAHANLVQHGSTGQLCSSEADYASAIACLENVENNRTAGVAARDWVAKEIGTWDDCAQRYVKLYQDLLVSDA